MCFDLILLSLHTAVERLRPDFSEEGMKGLTSTAELTQLLSVRDRHFSDDSLRLKTCSLRCEKSARHEVGKYCRSDYVGL